MKYPFKSGITCSKCKSPNVKLHDNMYYVKLANQMGYLLMHNYRLPLCDRLLRSSCAKEEAAYWHG